MQRFRSRISIAPAASTRERSGCPRSRSPPGGIQYGTGEGTRFLIFPSSGRSSGTHTQIGFTVTDIEAEVADLKRRGVTFEAYEMPGFDRSTSIATFPTIRSAWFKDTEGNLLGIAQFVTPA